MSKERDFLKRYSLNIARMKPGKNEDDFEISSEFFEHFELSSVKKGELKAHVDMHKYGTHVDATFVFSGWVELQCDRCGEPYHHQYDTTERIIYSFDSSMDFEGYEVMFTNPGEDKLDISQELYDFIQVAVPLRKVPEKEVHLCAPEVLKALGLDEEGKLIHQEESAEEEEIDPRWAALKKLKGEEG